MTRSRERLLALRREDDSTLFSSSPKVKSLRAAVGGRPVPTDERTARIQELGRRGLPSFPGPSVVPEIVVGAPALLREEMEAYDRVRMLASAYRSAVLSKCDVRSNFMTSAAKLGAQQNVNLAVDQSLKLPRALVEPVPSGREVYTKPEQLELMLHPPAMLHLLHKEQARLDCRVGHIR